MKIRNLCFLPFAFAVLLLSACKKESTNSTLQIRMTDAPATYDEVNIDLKEINIKFASDTAGWVNLQTTPGIYNLLSFQNGLDTLIAQGTFPSNVVKEIRLVLGDGNTVKFDGQAYPLTIPSGSESGLKIKVSKNLHASIETLLIDFDAALSVNQEVDGFKLRPVLRIK